MGCILAELFTGRVLFQNESVPTMLARIAGIVGPFPRSLLDKARHAPRFFTRQQGLPFLYLLLYILSENDCTVIYERTEAPGQVLYIYPKRCKLHHRVPTQDEMFLDFISQLLTIDPDKRS